MMAALSIRQPWAWLVVQGYKDIENRDWPTNFRGPLLVHAGLTMTRSDYEQAAQLLDEAGLLPPGGLPAYEALPRGGLVGWTRVVDCCQEHASPWKQADRWGFVLRDSQPMPFLPWKGRLNFFNVPKAALQGWAAA